MPKFNALAREYEGRVDFVTISVDEHREDWAQMVATMDPAVRHLWLDRSQPGPGTSFGIPHYYVFSADGKLVEEGNNVNIKEALEKAAQ